MDEGDRALLEHYVADGRGLDARGVPRGPGPNELASRKREADAYTRELLSLFDKSLGLAEKTFTRYATEKGRTDAALEDSFRNALLEIAAAEGKALAKQAPFGKVIMITLELSNAFAGGVGAGIVDAHRKAQEGSRGLSIEEQAVYERRYLARGVGELETVLRKGLADAAVAAIGILFREAGDTLKKAAGDVVSQVAKQLPKHCELFGILNADVKAVSGRIPAGRGGVERIAFSFVSRLFIREYGGEKLAEKMGPVFGGMKSKESIDIGLLGGLIQVLANGSYRTYKAAVPVDKAVDELRSLLVEQARGLILRNEARVTTGDALVVQDDQITVPIGLYQEIIREPGPVSPEEYSRLLQREVEYRALRARLSKDLADIGRVYQARINRLPAALQEEEAMRLRDRLVDHRNKCLTTLNAVGDRVVQEFGENVSGYGPVRDRVTLGDLPLPELSPLPYTLQQWVPLRDRPRR